MRRMALEKAVQGRRRAVDASVPLVAGDTVVNLGQTIFGKPADREHAASMLRALSDSTHEVHTSVAVCCGGRQQVVVVRSEVTFAALTDAEIDAYWRSGEPLGKAGAYAIQGLGACFVKHLSGSHSSVMGLPVFETRQLLRSLAGDPVSRGVIDA